MSNFFSQFLSVLKGNEYDYTQGSIERAILMLSIPIIVEISLGAVFAVVDMYFIGNLPDSGIGIAAVGLTESFVAVIYTFAIGISTGATAIIARRIGEKNHDTASQTSAQVILLTSILVVFISIFGVVYASDILKLVGAQQEVVEAGTIYTQIILGSSVSIVYLFILNGIFRGAGDSSMAMKSLWLALGINILLDPLLIYGYGPIPAYGIKGGAIATVIGRSVGVLYQCYYLFGNSKIIRLNRTHFKWNTPIVKTIMKLSGPATLQNFVPTGSFLVIVYLVALSGSTEAVAGHQVALRNITFFMLPAWGLASASATLTGQNLGANRPERAVKTIWTLVKYNIVFMILASLIVIIFSPSIVRFYTDDPNVIKYGILALRLLCLGNVLYGVGSILMAALNGAGDTKTPLWVNIFGFWFFQIPFAWFTSVKLGVGVLGVFMAGPISEIFFVVALYYFFKKGKWKEIRI